MPADKGRATEVFDKECYFAKAEELLHSDTYRQIRTDPTTSYQNKLINLLKDLKKKGCVTDEFYRRVYPTACNPPRFYGLPKIHKPSCPLRPIVSSIGSVGHALAGEIAKVLSPMVGQTCHHVRNSKDFCQQIEGISILPDEVMVSYDVRAVFTSVPVHKVIPYIKSRLESDSDLPDHTGMIPDTIIGLLEFCLSTTYFLYRGAFYTQASGAAMGSPVSTVVANLHMEVFEQQCLAPYRGIPPRVWLRYVDDTFVVISKDELNCFTYHVNNIDSCIKFTHEVVQSNQLPFLDTLVHRLESGALRMTVYRKPTHTDQYLHFSSHHPLQHK